MNKIRLNLGGIKLTLYQSNCLLCVFFLQVFYGWMTEVRRMFLLYFRSLVFLVTNLRRDRLTREERGACFFLGLWPISALISACKRSTRLVVLSPKLKSPLQCNIFHALESSNQLSLKYSPNLSQIGSEIYYKLYKFSNWILILYLLPTWISWPYVSRKSSLVSAYKALLKSFMKFSRMSTTSNLAAKRRLSTAWRQWKW